MNPSEGKERLLAIADLASEAISDRARRLAGFSLFDWMVVAQTGDDSLTDTACRLRIALAGGRHLDSARDLAAPMPDDVLADGLRRKAVAPLGEQSAGELWSAAAALERHSARDLARLLIG